MNGSTIKLEVKLSETVLDLKKRLQSWTGKFPVNQRLIFSGKYLTDDRTLGSYGIQSSYTVQLVDRYTNG
jgi:hypothetical protein